jgi:hypothetical protein
MMNIWDAVVGYFWMSRIRQLPVFVNQFVQKYVSLASLFFTCVYKLGTMSSKMVVAENILKQAAKLQRQKRAEIQKLITGTDHLLLCFYLKYSAVVVPHFLGEIIFKDQLLGIFKTLLM